MIQVRSEFILYFLSEEFFEHDYPNYYNMEKTEGQKRRDHEWCPYHDEERGCFVAVRKK
jgi:hypothetical protein